MEEPTRPTELPPLAADELSAEDVVAKTTPSDAPVDDAHAQPPDEPSPSAQTVETAPSEEPPVTEPAAATEPAEETAAPETADVELTAQSETTDETPSDSDAVTDVDEDEDEDAGSTGPIEEVDVAEEETEKKRDWYILKVQSNREDSIRDALMRRIAVAGLDEFFGDVIVPTEMVSEFKAGKKRVVKRKLYPGYIVVNMEINDDTWFLVRDTPGVGDFTGSAGKPSPMLPHEVSRILVMESDETKEKGPKPKISFRQGDRVKINEGTFDNFEGDVDAVDEANGRVTVMINIFGRSTPVELEYWQVEAV